MGIVYFIRHAESIVNVSREFSYKLVDKSLTEKGIKQASQLADYLDKVDFSFLFSSPMKRALETSEFISKKRKIPVRIVEEIREVNVGDLEKTPPSKLDDAWKLYFDIAHSWYSGTPERRYPGGENMYELVDRFNTAVKQVVKESSDEPAVLLGHGGIFITGLAEILTNVDRSFFYKNRWYNCGIATVKIIIENGKLIGQLIDFGNISFLKGITSEQHYSVPKFEK
ncbi:MAG: histidine phosphatase family protein [Candidatus Lokiarchaeota archaeon]|nr:histidine phosphatase family protein [Candidatus Lokiarchaeota archaeon]